ncbi:MAG: hypothetical protein HXX11_06835 [Desulfuromonadales bacterium]|nr:hypothetical protein [Desulfuromonadales bacterium]
MTVVPEIRNFFGISVPQPLRIAQLLGLPPEYGVFKTYSSWFNNRSRYGYTKVSSPYPWTRLGYTYDWGSSNHTGLSEFVLHGRKVD